MNKNYGSSKEKKEKMEGCKELAFIAKIIDLSKQCFDNVLSFLQRYLLFDNLVYGYNCY